MILTTQNQAMKLCEESLRIITAVKFYENYLDRNARMSWEDFRDKVDEAITHHSNPELTGFKSGGCIRRSLVFGTGDLRIQIRSVPDSNPVIHGVNYRIQIR